MGDNNNPIPIDDADLVRVFMWVRDPDEEVLARDGIVYPRFVKSTEKGHLILASIPSAMIEPLKQREVANVIETEIRRVHLS